MSGNIYRSKGMPGPSDMHYGRDGHTTFLPGQPSIQGEFPQPKSSRLHPDDMRQLRPKIQKATQDERASNRSLLIGSAVGVGVISLVLAEALSGGTSERAAQRLKEIKKADGVIAGDVHLAAGSQGLSLHLPEDASQPTVDGLKVSEKGATLHNPVVWTNPINGEMWAGGYEAKDADAIGSPAELAKHFTWFDMGERNTPDASGTYSSFEGHQVYSFKLGPDGAINVTTPPKDMGNNVATIAQHQ